MLVGLFLGVGIPVGIILLLDMLNDKVRSIDEVKRALPFPVLGDIPELPQEEVTLLRENFSVSESMQVIREKLNYMLGEKACPVLLVTSGYPGGRRWWLLTWRRLMRGRVKRRYWLVVICETRSYTRIFIRIIPWLVGLPGRNGTGMETAGTFARRKFKRVVGGDVPPNPVALCFQVIGSRHCWRR